LITSGIGAITGAFKDGLVGAREAATVFAQSEAVIKSTGGAAGVTAAQVRDYSGALSDAAGKSLFSGEQVTQSENLLMTFTNIKGKSLEAATAISVDMAQAMGGAPKDAAIQLGKALNDPIAGISALSRVGVTFDAEQKKNIATMIQHKDVAGAQAIILKELNKEFGGSAEAAAKAAGGGHQFKAAMDDAIKGVAISFLPALDKVGSVLASPAVLGGMQHLADLLSNGLTKGIDIASKAFASIADLWGRAYEAASGLSEQVGIMIDTFLGFTGAVRPMQTVGIALDAIIGRVQGMVKAFQVGKEGGDGFVSGLSNMLYFLDDLSPAFDTLGDAVIAIAKTVVTSMPQVQAVFAQVFPYIQSIVTTFVGVYVGHWTTIFNTVQKLLPSIQAIILNVFGIIQGFLATNGASIMTTVTGAWNSIDAIVKSVTASVQSIILSIFGGVATFLQGHSAQIQAFLTTSWLAIRDIITTVVQIAQATIVPAFSAIAGFLQDHSALIQAVLTGAWTIISTVISTTLATIQGVLHIALDVIQGNWSGAWEQVKATFSTILNGLGTILSTVLNGLGAIITGIGPTLAAAATSIGHAIIDGIRSGITAGIGALEDAIKGAAQAALNAAKDILKTHSPSRVFHDEVGLPIAQGMAQGILDGAPIVYNAMRVLTTGTVQTATDIIGGRVTPLNVGPVVGYDPNYHPPASDNNANLIIPGGIAPAGFVQPGSAAGPNDAGQIARANGAPVGFVQPGSDAGPLDPGQLDRAAAAATNTATAQTGLRTAVQTATDAHNAQKVAATDLGKSQGALTDIIKNATGAFTDLNTAMNQQFYTDGMNPVTGVISFLTKIEANLDAIVAKAQAARGAMAPLGNMALPAYSGGSSGGGGTTTLPGTRTGGTPPPNDPGGTVRAFGQTVNYHLNVSTNQSSSGVIQDFQMMQAFAGGS
jgi:hypothetical protein